MNNELERNVLRNFFEKICAENPQDNTISDSKFVRDAKNQLKVALRGATERCSCAKRTWGGPCEVCQASDGEIYYLRNFFREIRNAKKNNLEPALIQEFIGNTQKWIKLSNNKI